ncbi:hypothetical protein MHPYR_500047 [uncultured Mycobacterium sp.]|uniref:Uncharacterized protein n=1 Tax=uncultured Mycobacterium sp. TaxID=171292 RepID=A0A1Y5PPP5_9MYCO|nr:hypothetical protein MHPYR_500047 [uncultured Mycobacterium sp.]
MWDGPPRSAQHVVINRQNKSNLVGAVAVAAAHCPQGRDRWPFVVIGSASRHAFLDDEGHG